MSNRARRAVVLDFGLGHSAYLWELMPVLCGRGAADRLPDGSFCLRLNGDRSAIALAVVARVDADAERGGEVAPARVYADVAASLAALPPGSEDFTPVVFACDTANLRRDPASWTAATMQATYPTLGRKT